MKRAAFVTIGQAPRTDMVPEMRSWIGDGIDIVEHGALDALDREAIDALQPRGTEPRLVTRLRDGSQAVVARESVHRRLQGLVGALAKEDYSFIVLLCTGHFSGLSAETLILGARAIVDHGVASIGERAGSIGILLPLEEQIGQFRCHPQPAAKLICSYASPYTPGRLELAARELAATDFIAMHCMGYSEEDRRTVAAIAGRPVLLARRLVAAAVSQLL